MKNASLSRSAGPAFFIFHFSFFICAAAEVDIAKLPPPATNRVEFVRDIKPILDRSCLRCHGAERPKSRFSLVTRESALKGGDNGVDIIPGDSAKSPLIHNVSGLVEDLEMPPKGKAPPLTPDEIGLLRAWIDQGVEWEKQPASWFSLSMAPTVGWTTVSGDDHKFREHYWMKDGWNGGAENFLLTDNVGKESKLTVEGRAFVDDYRVQLTLEKKEVGFTRFGWEQYRKYFDDTGGYFPGFNPSTFSLDRDLHLDVGRAWADFGLTLPHWPRMVIGYEYQYRDGEKSTLQWGGVGTTAPGAPGTDARNIFPSAKAIDEQVHVLKFDLDHEIAGVQIEETFRGEFYDLRTSRLNVRSFILGGPSPGLSQLNDIREGYNYFQGANTFRLEKSFTDWLLASVGHLYSKLNADATFSMDTLLPFGAPPPGIIAYGDQWRTHGITLQRETHVFNATTLLGPWQGLNLSAGVLSEWTREQGVGSANKDQFIFFPPGPASQRVLPSTFDVNLDKSKVEESVALRYTTIPYTVLFAEARLEQQRIGQFQEEFGGATDFLRDVDASSDLQDFRAGFSTSPWQSVSLNGHYRHSDKESNYERLPDTSSALGPGYPAFLRWRDVATDEVEAKLTWRPWAWLKTSFNYQYETTKFQTATEQAGNVAADDIATGAQLESAHYDAHRYSVNATLTPWQRLFLSGTFSYQDTRVAAFDNSSPSLVPYRGDLFSVISSATYALNEKTDLHGSYSFSWADYGQNNFAGGLPVGIRYQQHALSAGFTRRINKNISAKLQYGFFYYDEPSSGHANDYTAHAVFATLVVRIP